MTKTQSQKKRARAAAISKARGSGTGIATNNAQKRMQAQINNLQQKINNNNNKSKKPQTQKGPKRVAPNQTGPSGYLKYLMYPEIKGGKIPDGASMVPTATKQFIFRGLFSMKMTNAVATAGVRVDISGNPTGVSAYTNVPIRVYLLDTSSTNSFVFNEISSNFMQTAGSQVSQWVNAVQPSTMRTVSLGVTSQYIGNTVSDQGNCLAWNDYDSVTPATIADFDNSDTVKRDRVSDRACKSIYRPMSLADQSFMTVNNVTSSTPSFCVGTRPQSMGVYYTNVASTFQAEFVIYWNVEYVPSSNVALGIYGTTPAVDDPAQMKSASTFFGRAAGYVAIPAILATATNYVYGNRPIPPPIGMRPNQEREMNGFLGYIS